MDRGSRNGADHALGDARRALAAIDLCLPPIPDEIARDLRALDGYLWATRCIERSDLHAFLPLVMEVLHGDPADYVALAHAGHGPNFCAFTYALVYRSVALFVQIPWGGALLDNEAQASTIRQAFGRCQDLVDGARAVDVVGSRRFLFVHTGLRRTNQYDWVARPATADQVGRWIQMLRRGAADDPVVPTWTDALRMIQPRPGRSWAPS